MGNTFENLNPKMKRLASGKRLVKRQDFPRPCILMNKSLAVHYFKLSADQGIAEAQYICRLTLATCEGISMNKSLAIHYFKLSADQGKAEGQFAYRVMLARCEGISMNKSFAVHSGRIFVILRSSSNE
jgi:TPR repeat protein